MQSIEVSLDQVLPRYDVAERHERLVPASAGRTFQAFCDLTPAEIPLATLLVAVRSLPGLLMGRSGAPPRLREPMLDQFLEAGFAVLRHRPGQDIVVGVIGQMWKPRGAVVRPDSLDGFRRFDQPGFVRAATSFTVVDLGDRSLAVTETRVAATDPAARRAFRRYWLVIGPFSGLIRRAWLRGIAARAAAPETASGSAG
ncbi:MAG TPA: hypothetical protein VI357_22980 [Mycobacteriales bacterium]